MPIIGGGFFGGSGGGGSSYIDGEVATYNDLPVSISTAPVNSAYLVLQASGVYLVNRKPAGIYVRNTANGNLADWAYAGDFPDVFNDDNFTVYDGADTSKNLKLELSGITSNTTRTLTAPDKNGTIATLSDLPAPTTDASLLTSGTLADARLSSNVSLDNINNNFTAGQTITAASNTSALTASYSVTGTNTTPLINLSGTWNTTGVASGILLNITDTASNASSRLLDLGIGGVSRFVVRKDGVISLNSSDHVAPTGIGYSAGGLGSAIVTKINNADKLIVSASWVNLPSGSVLGWVSGTGLQGAADTILARDAANTLAQRNGTNAQTFRLYNTFTDASNYERGFMRWNTNVLEIGTEFAGTGTFRSVRLYAGSTNPIIFAAASASSVVDISGARSLAFASGLGIATNNTSTITGLSSINYASGAADPTTSSLASGNWQVHRNTTTGVARLWANNNGTMVSVALS